MQKKRPQSLEAFIVFYSLVNSFNPTIPITISNTQTIWGIDNFSLKNLLILKYAIPSPAKT